MRVDRIAVKQSTEQHDLWREQMKPRRDCFGVFAQNFSAALDDFHYACIAARRGFKNDRCEHGDFHFVRRLRPANEFVKIVQRKCVQDFRSKLHLNTMQIVFTQDQAQRSNGKKITAARVAENMSPPARVLNPVATTPGYRRATSRVDHNPVAMFESCC